MCSVLKSVKGPTCLMGDLSRFSPSVPFRSQGFADHAYDTKAVCRRIQAENGLEIEASSAGTSDRANRPVTINW